jgi:hypothetical protein
VPQKPENDSKVVGINPEISHKMLLKKKVDALSTGRWNLVHEMLISIQAADEIDHMLDEKKIPCLKDQIEVLKRKLQEEYADETEALALMLESIPSYNSIRSWTLTEDWKQAVMDKIKGAKIFDIISKTKVYEAIFKKAAITGDMKAAELYFKLSGELGATPKADPQEKLSKEEKEYKEFNNILHRK